MFEEKKKEIRMPVKKEIYKVKAMIPYWDNYSTKPTEYSPYRILEVDSDMTLYDFGAFILSSFDFDFDHAFGFYENVKSYYSSKKGFVMRFKDEDEWSSFDWEKKYGNVDEATVADMLTRRGKRWLMLFDYGDEWNFWVSLDDKDKVVQNVEYPRIVETHLKPPLQYE